MDGHPLRWVRVKRQGFASKPESGQGGGAGSPLGVAAAIITAPIMAPIMFFEARRNDDRVLSERVEGARRNQSPPPLIDARSAERAAAVLGLVLDRGAVNETRTGRTSTTRTDTSPEA